MNKHIRMIVLPSLFLLVIFEYTYQGNSYILLVINESIRKPNIPGRNSYRTNKVIFCGFPYKVFICPFLKKRIASPCLELLAQTIHFNAIPKLLEHKLFTV